MLYNKRRTVKFCSVRVGLTRSLTVSEMNHPSAALEQVEENRVLPQEGAPPNEPLAERLERVEQTCEDLCERVLQLQETVSQLQEDVQAIQSRQTELQETLNDSMAARETWPSASSWLLLDMWNDVRLTWRMFRDARYRVAWVTVLLVLGAVFYLTIWPAIRSWLHWGWSIPVVSYVDNLVVAYLGLKALSRELRRYEYFLSVRGRR